jgi:hypothetical protein
MNEGQLTDKIMERRDLPPMAKVIMRAIIRRVDWKTWTSKEGHKVVSTRELALKCGTTKKTVIANMARLEKAGLIQRDFFKAKPTQAPPVRVMVDNISNYNGGVESTPQGGVESIPPSGVESTPPEVKKVHQGDIENTPPRGVESIPLSIEDNSNTIINTINYTTAINPSLGNEWGVSSGELWGDELVNGLSIVSSKGKIK